MVHCAAIDCTNSSSKKNDENISFFKLPKDSRRKIWIVKLKRENLPKDEKYTGVIYISKKLALREI